MKTIWVTGAAGFSGQHLLAWLDANDADAKVIPITRQGTDTDIVVADVSDFDSMRALAQREPPDEVYHLAGAMPPADAATMWASFVQSTWSLMRAIDEADCEGTRILIAGSAAEYLPGDGSPIIETHPIGGFSPYGLAKAAQVQLALRAGECFGQDVVVGRTFNLVGPGMSRSFVLGEICAQLAEGTDALKLGRTDAERDFIDIRDAVAAYGALMASNASGEAFNVCSGTATSIRQLVDLAVAATGTAVSVESESDRLRSNDFDRVIGNPEKLRQLTGWSPAISLETAVADTVASFRP